MHPLTQTSRSAALGTPSPEAVVATAVGEVDLAGKALAAAHAATAAPADPVGAEAP
ncbi:MAG: hypothetical protein Q8Q02_08215 [Nocardioides sp.]|nr:hypothetical protein [Nocardioides sp.]